MGLGLEGGKVAVCNGAGKNVRGKKSVADGKWHMVAWYAALRIAIVAHTRARARKHTFTLSWAVFRVLSSNTPEPMTGW